MKTLKSLCFLLLLIPVSLFSQSHYPGQHIGKFKIPDTLESKIDAFDLSDVHLLNGRFKENMIREQKWLLSLSAQRLLHTFRTNAGIYDGNEGGYFTIEKLGGWESLDCELRGHSVGHIMSGLALMYASTGDQVYKLKGDSLVNGLAEVQTVLNQNGYLSAFPQNLIDRNLAGQRVWAPWYTLHKIFSGLIDQYLYNDNKQALEVATKMGLWAYDKLQPVTAEQRTIMLRNEFGGINDSFFNLYAITGNEKFKWVANFFYHNETLDPLKAGEDILDKKHANTYIPKLIGLAREYELEGKGDGQKIASFFWNTVVNHHSFATGSNSDKEKFFKADDISHHLSGYTGESCNVYNMLKLTRHLYTETGDFEYTNYYEKALFNHILGQQDPQTGMIAYFLPMLPGAHKVYSTPEKSFWCCVGTGFENQAKYGEAIYYHKNENLFIDLFIASELNWKEKGIKLKQETVFPENGKVEIQILESAKQKATFNFRYPYWATSVNVKLNGKNIKISQKPDSYIKLSKSWRKGDKIELDFGMGLHLVPANDNPEIAAVAYGPIVLAGQMGTEGFVAKAPFSDPNKYNDYYTYDYNVPDNIKNYLSLNKNNLGKSIEKVEGKPLTFKTANNIILKPLYNTHHERYVVYWNTTSTK
ncbi:beta-L-arabinofuranosidase domain-containing protein [Pelobium manganitolerans]|uniref:glycoside hydrolase family 127 protein n=1 Tax=Pelobium manganitolerans TaxID=1842495 RepID=UPI003FA3AD47